MSTVVKNCKACGMRINVRLADHKRGWGNFCDKSCKGAYSAGQRPRDVNKAHAKHRNAGGWAYSTNAAKEANPEAFAPAPPIKEQVGHKVKVTPLLHSPPTKRDCRDCGKVTTNGFLCEACEMHADAMMASESGWDGHK